jgi:hypothetical protein
MIIVWQCICNWRMRNNRVRILVGMGATAPHCTSIVSESRGKVRQRDKVPGLSMELGSPASKASVITTRPKITHR